MPNPNPYPNPNPSYAGPSLWRTFAMAALRYGGPVPFCASCPLRLAHSSLADYPAPRIDTSHRYLAFYHLALYPRPMSHRAACGWSHVDSGPVHFAVTQIAPQLLWKANRNSYTIYQMVPFSITLNEPADPHFTLAQRVT